MTKAKAILAEFRAASAIEKIAIPVLLAMIRAANAVGFMFQL